MLRLVIHGLAILHLAPAFAFLVLAFGCDPYLPWLGSFCGQGPLLPFAQLTLAATAVLVAASALVHRRGKSGRAAKHARLRRDTAAAALSAPESP